MPDKWEFDDAGATYDYYVAGAVYRQTARERDVARADLVTVNLQLGRYREALERIAEDDAHSRREAHLIARAALAKTQEGE